MTIEKKVTITWSDEEEETIASFREFIHERAKELEDNGIDAQLLGLNRIDNLLFNLVYDNDFIAIEE